MQLIISHNTEGKLSLPINYLHILQSIIYHAISGRKNYAGDTGTETFNTTLHDNGYMYGDRRYKDFTFSWLKGTYYVSGKSITFADRVSFEVRSTNPQMIHIIADNIKRYGITYLNRHYDNVSVSIRDTSIERMCIYKDDYTCQCV